MRLFLICLLLTDRARASHRALALRDEPKVSSAFGGFDPSRFGALQ